MVITGKSNYQVITGNYQGTNLVTIIGAAHGGQENLGGREPNNEDLAKMPAVAALEAAESRNLCPADAKKEERATLLSGRFIRVMSAQQIQAVHFLVATFFFVCRIPFVIIEHWAFVALVTALAPEYANHLFISTYLKTVWFGARRHTSAVYGAEIQKVAGDGSDVFAAVADNTGSMSSLRKGLFGFLQRMFPCWFLLGCYVHCWDLLAATRRTRARPRRPAPLRAPTPKPRRAGLRLSPSLTIIATFVARTSKLPVNYRGNGNYQVIAGNYRSVFLVTW